MSKFSVFYFLRKMQASENGCCPVCGDSLPAPAKRGRPRQFCSQVCTERARQRRKKAAFLLERIDRLAAIAAKQPPAGNGRGQAEYAARLRLEVDELLNGIGPGSVLDEVAGRNASTTPSPRPQVRTW